MLMIMLLLVIMEDFLLGVADAATWEVMIRRSRQVVGIHVAEAVHGLACSIPDPSEKGGPSTSCFYDQRLVGLLGVDEHFDAPLLAVIHHLLEALVQGALLVPQIL
jgi:hypothetical protein